MKIMIDISEEVKKHCDMQGMMIQTIDIVAMRKAIKSGITIPDNATNGDVIETVFPNCVADNDFADTVITMIDGKQYWRKEWWNAPYKREEE